MDTHTKFEIKGLAYFSQKKALKLRILLDNKHKNSKTVDYPLAIARESMNNSEQGRIL